MKNHVELPDGYKEMFQIDLQKDKRLALFINGIALLIIIVMAIVGHFFVPITELLDGTAIQWVVICMGVIVYIACSFSKLPDDILVKDIGVNMTVYAKEN